MSAPRSFEHLGVSADEAGRVVHLDLHHGKANEMGVAQIRELEGLVEELVAGPAQVLITSSRRTSSKGTPIFVAGANVTERAGWTDDEVKAHVSWQRDVLVALRSAPVFHVCVVNGVALGWGTELLLTADYRIAATSASFALPETGLGILPGAGGTADLFAHVGIPQALRLGMTGERIDAVEATRIGLVQETVADMDAGLARAEHLAQLVLRRSPTAVASFKAGVLRAVGRPGPERLAIEQAAYAHCVDSGEAAIGRAHFRDIIQGEPVPWQARTLPEER